MNDSLTARAWTGAQVAALGSTGSTPGPLDHVDTAALGALAHPVQWWARLNRHGLIGPRHTHAVLVAGDHPGVAAAGASTRTPADTLEQVRSLHAGTAVMRQLADDAGIPLHLHDISMAVAPSEVPGHISQSRICDGAGRIDHEDAASHNDIAAAFAYGRTCIDQLADAGADLVLLGTLGAGSSAPATAIITLLTNSDLVDNIGRADVADDVMWMHKTALIREAVLRTRPHTHDPLGMLAVCGGADLAAVVGALIQGAVRGLPILMDGVTTAAAALIAERMLPGAHVWWAVADRGHEPAAMQAYERLSLNPWLAFGHVQSGVTASLMALPLLQTALRIASASH